MKWPWATAPAEQGTNIYTYNTYTYICIYLHMKEYNKVYMNWWRSRELGEKGNMKSKKFDEMKILKEVSL